MRALLTSAGLTTPSLQRAFDDLCGRDASSMSVAFIPTAAWRTTGDKGWLVANLNQFHSACRTIDVIEPSLLDRAEWLPRLQSADVLVLGGGDASYLLAQMRSSGLLSDLRDLARSRVYVGISAGSVVAGPDIAWLYRLHDRAIDAPVDALNLAPVAVLPHRESQTVPDDRWSDIAGGLPYGAHHLSDDAAVLVADDAITLVNG